MQSDLRKVGYTLYAFIIFSFFYMICFTCKIKNYTYGYSKPLIKHTDSNKAEKKIEKPQISFILPNLSSDNTHCLKDSLTIEDNVKSFNRKICYWGDGDSSLYEPNETRQSHKYATIGEKTITLFCDSVVIASKNVNIICEKLDSNDFSIYPENKPNISQNNLIFNSPTKLVFYSNYDSSNWLIDGKLYKGNIEKTFRQHGNIKIVFKPGKTNFHPCLCDSTFILTFIP